MASRAVEDVSREAHAKLDLHWSEVRRWTKRINLVAGRSLEDGWTRHVSDSIQIFDAWDGTGIHWADLGSGSGYPGLVVAILAQDRAPRLRITLVDSDLRKCSFLAHVARLVGVSVNVQCGRIETLPSLAADVVSARALAPLDRLLDLAVPHMAPGAYALFPKGARHQAEIAEARKRWRFDCGVLPSETDPEAAILTVRNIAHV